MDFDRLRFQADVTTSLEDRADQPAALRLAVAIRRATTGPVPNGVDLVSGMALATGVGFRIRRKTPAASAVPLTHHRLSPRHSGLSRREPRLTRTPDTRSVGTSPNGGEEKSVVGLW